MIFLWGAVALLLALLGGGVFMTPLMRPNGMRRGDERYLTLGVVLGIVAMAILILAIIVPGLKSLGLLAPS